MSEPSAWTLPDVKGPVVAARGRSPSASAIVEAEREAWRAGFEQGRRDGLAAVETAAAERLARLDRSVAELQRLCDQLARPLEPLDEDVAQELARLALRTGAQLARRELALDPSQVIAIIREAVGLLPIGAREVRVYTHPLDAAAIRERLTLNGGDRAWQLVDDPVMARGGCRVVSEFSQIDARLDSRLAAIVSTVLGDERGMARGGDDAGREP